MLGQSWRRRKATCFLNDNGSFFVYTSCLLTLSLLGLLVYLLHAIGAPWPFQMMPLPHCDSTPSLAFGLVTDAERSFDIVPVSQRFVGYRSDLFQPLTCWCLHQLCSLMQYISRKYSSIRQECVQMTWFCEDDVLFLWGEITGTSKETDKPGCDRESCERGRTVHSRRDRFLFRWKWGLMLVRWGERRAAFASKWTPVLQKRSSITDNKNIKSSKAAGLLFISVMFPIDVVSYWL